MHEKPRRVFLHVGTPKTGTTYLQNLLWENRRVLARHGCHYPAASPQGHFPATLSLQGHDYTRWSLRQGAPAWERLVERVSGLYGDVVLSHELLSEATAEQADRAVAELSDGAEVHVVLTARDLLRQVPAVWQENVKNGDATSFDDFLARIRSDRSEMFWVRQDLSGVLARWGRRLPPGRVHVVTVPPHGAAPAQLWQRFARVLGVEAAGVTAPATMENASLGWVETELLRRVNGQLAGRLSWPVYRRRVGRYLLPVLAGGSSARVPMNGPTRKWLADEADHLMAEVRSAGYDVVGDLADLRISVGEPEPDVVDDVALPDLLTAATTAMAEILVSDPAGPASLRREARRAWFGVRRRFF